MGGQLELWDMTTTSCVQRISPISNRMVVFATTDLSYHGLPHPLQCRPGVTRCSLVFHYYTNRRPVHEPSPLQSLFVRRQGKTQVCGPLWKDFTPPAALGGTLRRGSEQVRGIRRESQVQ